MFGENGAQPTNEEYVKWYQQRIENEYKKAKQDEFVEKICKEGIANVSPEIVRDIYEKGSLKEKIKAFGLNEKNAGDVIADAIREEQIKIQAEELRKQLEEAKKQPPSGIPTVQPPAYQAPSATNADTSEHNMVFDGRAFDPMKDDKLTNLTIAEKVMLKMAYGG